MQTRRSCSIQSCCESARSAIRIALKMYLASNQESRIVKQLESVCVFGEEGKQISYMDSQGAVLVLFIIEKKGIQNGVKNMYLK